MRSVAAFRRRIARGAAGGGAAAGPDRRAPPIFRTAIASPAVPIAPPRCEPGSNSLAGDGIAQVLIHDAARPLVPQAVIRRVVAALAHGPAAAPGLAVTDALWRADGDRVTGTAPRDGLWRAQTPQGFDYAAIRAAHAGHPGGAADDVEVALAAGLPVTLVEGDEASLKLTTPADWRRAETMLEGAMDVRVGQGFDVHAFGPGDHVTLCGLRLDHDRGLVGHSDADVGLHAICDAIYGALSEGDIGRHFPPGEAAWKGADSMVFLDHAGRLAASRGYRRQPDRRDADLRAAEDRPACRGDAGADRAGAGRRGGPDLGEGHHFRAAGLHRPRRRHRGARHRHAGEAMSRLVASVFGLGFLRPAPGTWGSLAALPLAWAIAVLGGPWAADPADAGGGRAGALGGDGRAETVATISDPSWIVIDELAGQWLALWPVVIGAAHAHAPFLALWPGWVAAFLLFRLFDIWKPWVIGRADRMGGARGVMLDDLLAGVFAAVGVAVLAGIAHGLLMR